jgi:hypothetical protein
VEKNTFAVSTPSTFVNAFSIFAMQEGQVNSLLRNIVFISNLLFFHSGNTINLITNPFHDVDQLTTTNLFFPMKNQRIASNLCQSEMGNKIQLPIGRRLILRYWN